MSGEHRLCEMSPKRTVASLSRLEKLWLKRRYCGFCEAPLLGSMCHAYSGLHTLPIVEGVRDEEKIVDLGPPCNMDAQRAKALTHYKPRPAQVGRNAKRQDPQGLGPKDEHAVAEGDAPNPSIPKDPQ